MLAGAETDPSDTINEIIFSTRKVRPCYVEAECCSVSSALRITRPISSTSAGYHAWLDFPGDRLLRQVRSQFNLLLHLGLSPKGVLVLRHRALATLTAARCDAGRQHWSYWRLCRLLRPLQCEPPQMAVTLATLFQFREPVSPRAL